MNTRDVEPLPSGSNLASGALINGKSLGAYAAVQMGNLYFQSLFFRVIPDATMSFLTKDDPSFAGVLGANFINSFATSFNFAHREIHLALYGNITPQELKTCGLDPKRTISVPLRVTQDFNNKYMVDMYCNDRQVALAIDTASENTVIYKSASEFGINPGDTKEVLFQEFQGISTLRSAPAKLRIFNATVNTPVYFRTDVNRAGDGQLGMDFLINYHVVLDPAGKKMYLCPRK